MEETAVPPSLFPTYGDVRPCILAMDRHCQIEVFGQRYGSEQTFLNVTQLPPHSHFVSAPVSSDDGGGDEPDGRVLGSASDPHYSPTPGANQFYKPFNSGNAGGNQGINNMQPYLVVNICIALQGLFPSRN
jgi:microcystin-dependent protein